MDTYTPLPVLDNGAQFVMSTNFFTTWGFLLGVAIALVLFILALAIVITRSPWWVSLIAVVFSIAIGISATIYPSIAAAQALDTSFSSVEEHYSITDLRTTNTVLPYVSPWSDHTWEVQFSTEEGTQLTGVLSTHDDIAVLFVPDTKQHTFVEYTQDYDPNRR
jgi:hypothetical protein